jgi:hypothetical protein
VEAAWHPYHFLADAALVSRRVRPPVVVGTVAGRVGHARCLALGSRLSAIRSEVDLDVSTGAIASRKRDKARRGCRTIALPTRAVALRAGCYRASVANPEAAGRMCVRAASVTVWNEEVGGRKMRWLMCGVISRAMTGDTQTGLAWYLRPVRPLLRSAELATLQPEALVMMMGVQEKVLPAPYANWNPTQFVAASQRTLQSGTVGVPPLYWSKLEEGNHGSGFAGRGGEGMVQRLRHSAVSGALSSPVALCLAVVQALDFVLREKERNAASK